MLLIKTWSSRLCVSYKSIYWCKLVAWNIIFRRQGCWAEFLWIIIIIIRIRISNWCLKHYYCPCPYSLPLPFSSSLSDPPPLLPFLPNLGSVWRVRPLTHTNHQCLPARTEKEHYRGLLRTLPPKCKSQRDGGEEMESNDAGWEKNRTKIQEKSLQVAYQHYYRVLAPKMPSWRISVTLQTEDIGTWIVISSQQSYKFLKIRWNTVALAQSL